MRWAHSTAGLDAATPARDRLAAVRAAGFTAAEWTVDQPDAPACRLAAAAAAEAGIELVSLACPREAATNLAAAEQGGREANLAFVLDALECAAAAGVPVVRLAPAQASRPGGPALCRYEDAELWAYEGLAAAAVEAERLGVQVAVAGAAGGFLLSPAEHRRFIDRLNSPWIGACLDIGRAAAVGDPADWQRALGQRTLLVVADPSAASADLLGRMAPECPVVLTGTPQQAAAFVAAWPQEAVRGR